MRILAIGDVVGSAAVNYLLKKLPAAKRELRIDFAVVNGENAAEIRGIAPNDVYDLFAAGADVITTGNHAFSQRSSYSVFDDEARLLRPANFPGGAPGHGYVIVNSVGVRVLVMNLEGNYAMNLPLSSQFAAADAILSRESGNFDIALVDHHAEATSEKLALGYYLDGRVSAVWGTHTHVPTADCRILPKGSGYITDLGMTGPTESVLGVVPEIIVRQMTLAMPQRYEVAKGEISACGAVFEIDERGRCVCTTSVKI